MGGYIGAKTGTLVATASNIKGDISATDTTPEITLKNTTETDADGSRSGKITFKGEQSGGEESTLAQIVASHDTAVDNEAGDLIFKTNDGSDGTSPTERLRIDSTGKSTFKDDVGIEGETPTLQMYDTNVTNNVMDVSYDEYLTFDIDPNNARGNSGLIIKADGTEIVRVKDTGRVGIGESTPDRFLHVNGGTTNTVAKFESTDTICSIDFTDNGGTAEIGNEGNDIVFFPAGTEKYRILNDGRFKTSETSYVQFTGAIHSSETRYYKLINYTSGYMLDGVVFMQANRNGGFNQSAGFRNYNCAVGGYSNALYGPITATGDSGESGNMTLYAGSDEAIYLKLTPNTYGGTVNCVIIGRIRTWDYDGTYVTSAP